MLTAAPEKCQPQRAEARRLQAITQPKGGSPAGRKGTVFFIGSFFGAASAKDLGFAAAAFFFGDNDLLVNAVFQLAHMRNNAHQTVALR